MPMRIGGAVCRVNALCVLLSAWSPSFPGDPPALDTTSPGAYPPAHAEWNPAVGAPLPGSEELLANPEFLALLQQSPDQTEKIMQSARAETQHVQGRF